jgi:hypothetical protein
MYRTFVLPKLLIIDEIGHLDATKPICFSRSWPGATRKPPDRQVEPDVRPLGQEFAGDAVLLDASRRGVDPRFIFLPSPELSQFTNGTIRRPGIDVF